MFLCIESVYVCFARWRCVLASLDGFHFHGEGENSLVVSFSHSQLTFCYFRMMLFILDKHSAVQACSSFVTILHHGLRGSASTVLMATGFVNGRDNSLRPNQCAKRFKPCFRQIVPSHWQMQNFF